MRLNPHALSPAVDLKEVKKNENKAIIHFALVPFTFNGKIREIFFAKNYKRELSSKKNARKEGKFG